MKADMAAAGGFSRSVDGAYETASGFGQSKENTLGANVYKWIQVALTYEHPRNRQARKSIDRYGVSHDQPSFRRATATRQAGVPGAVERRAPRVTESPKAPSTSGKRVSCCAIRPP